MKERILGAAPSPTSRLLPIAMLFPYSLICLSPMRVNVLLLMSAILHKFYCFQFDCFCCLCCTSHSFKSSKSLYKLLLYAYLTKLLSLKVITTLSFNHLIWKVISMLGGYIPFLCSQVTISVKSMKWVLSATLNVSLKIYQRRSIWYIKRRVG